MMEGGMIAAAAAAVAVAAKVSYRCLLGVRIYRVNDRYASDIVSALGRKETFVRMVQFPS